MLWWILFKADRWIISTREIMINDIERLLKSAKTSRLNQEIFQFLTRFLAKLLLYYSTSKSYLLKFHPVSNHDIWILRFINKHWILKEVLPWTSQLKSLPNTRSVYDWISQCLNLNPYFWINHDLGNPKWSSEHRPNGSLSFLDQSQLRLLLATKWNSQDAIMH